MDFKQPLLKKPAGPSKLGQFSDGGWCTFRMTNDGPIDCQICGTTHPAREGKSYSMSRIFGLQVVDECCGAVLDDLYRDLARDFAIQYLWEFANNPAGSSFYVLRSTLKKALTKAKEKLAETSEAVAEISEVADAI